jgi:hypothetical protein
MNITVSNSNNIFYANDTEAELAQPRFESGTAALTVDGLLIEAEKQIMGIPAASIETLEIGGTTYELMNYGEKQEIPYEGIAVVLQRQSKGIVFYQALILRKTQFAQFDVPANTEGESIEWQTTALSAEIFRDDTEDHVWKTLSKPVETKLEAYNIGRVFLGGTAVQTLPE